MGSVSTLGRMYPMTGHRIAELKWERLETKAQADVDFRKKVKLEQKLHRALRVLDREIAETFTKVLSESAQIIDMHSRALEPLKGILRQHYFDVETVFDSQLRKKLAKDVLITEIEEVTIRSALSTHFEAKAAEQANLILNTHQKNAIEAFAQGRQAAALDEITDNRQIARISGNILDRKFVGREQGISVLETLHSAEASKATEFEVLSGSNTLSVRGEVPIVETHKIWTTMGDHRVRGAEPGDDFDHILADEQRVLGGEPFRVSGQLLNNPGDTSLGASIGNVARCRCATRFDIDEINEVRRAA